MPALRREFYATLRQMLRMADIPILTDRLPTTDPHNLTARVLRLGIAVTAFASLEKYLEARTEFLVGHFPSIAPNVSSLSDELRAFFSVDALMGLANRAGFVERSVKQAYVDANISSLAQYNATPPSFTALGFSPRGSNVSEGDIARVLGVFGVQKPWKALSNVATALGSSRLSLQEDFTGLARTRHRSAHNPNSNIPSADLKTHIETAILIGICFDCVSLNILDALQSTNNFKSYEKFLATNQLPYRFVDEESNGNWVERTSDGKRVRKRHQNENAALMSSSARLSPGIIVVRGIQSTPLAVY